MSRAIWFWGLAGVVTQVQCVHEVSACETTGEHASMWMLQVSVVTKDIGEDYSLPGFVDAFGQAQARQLHAFGTSLKRVATGGHAGAFHLHTDDMHHIGLVAGIFVVLICIGTCVCSARLNLTGSIDQNAQGENTAQAFESSDASAVHDNGDATGLALLPLLCISLGAHAMCCTDSYVPNMPEMASDLHATNSLMALTLPLNWMAKGIASLFLGTYSDAVGRKPVMMGCCLTIVMSSIMCAVATSYATFLAARILQGIGEGVDAVVQAIIRDKYPDLVDRQKIMVIVQATLMLSPMIAAPAFGLLGTYVGWRTVFIIMAIWGLANLTLCVCILKHQPPRQHTPIIAYFATAKNILTSMPLISLLSVITLTWCSKQTALSSLAFVLQEDLGISPQGTVLALALIPLFVPPGILISRMSSQSTSPTFTLKAIMVAQIFSVGMFFLSGFLFATHVWGVVGPYCFGATLNIAALVAANTIFMEPFKEFAGVAGGILSCSRELLGGIAALFGSQIALHNAASGLLCFNGAMLSLMLALFWFGFGISTPSWALTEGEKNNKLEQRDASSTASTPSPRLAADRIDSTSSSTEREKNEEPN